MFRRKTWIEVKRHYQPPSITLKTVNGPVEPYIKKAVLGYTQIEMRCVETGEIKVLTEYGDLT